MEKIGNAAKEIAAMCNYEGKNNNKNQFVTRLYTEKDNVNAETNNTNVNMEKIGNVAKEIAAMCNY